MRKLLKKAEDLIKASNTPDVEGWQNILRDFEKEVKRVKNSRIFLSRLMRGGYVRAVVDSDIIDFYKKDGHVMSSPEEVIFESLKILGFKPEAA